MHALAPSLRQLSRLVLVSCAHLEAGSVVRLLSPGDS